MNKNNNQSAAMEKIKFEVGQEMGLVVKKDDNKVKKNFNK